jgi:hypothetical protein
MSDNKRTEEQKKRLKQMINERSIEQLGLEGIAENKTIVDKPKSNNTRRRDKKKNENENQLEIEGGKGFQAYLARKEELKNKNLEQEKNSAKKSLEEKNASTQQKREKIERRASLLKKYK